MHGLDDDFGGGSGSESGVGRPLLVVLAIDVVGDASHKHEAVLTTAQDGVQHLVVLRVAGGDAVAAGEVVAGHLVAYGAPGSHHTKVNVGDVQATRVSIRTLWVLYFNHL